MHLKDSIKEKVARVLFGTSYEKLTLLWQGKVEETANIIYVEVIKPLRMMNSALLETELILQQERKHLQEQIQHLEQVIEKLQAAN